MRAILIDPAAKTVTEIQTTGKLDDIYRHLQCRHIEAAAVADDSSDLCYVHDEGMLAEDAVFFTLGERGHPLPGRGLIVGTDDNGEDAAPALTLAQAIDLVRFPDIELAGFEEISGTTTHPMFGDKPIPVIGHRAVFRAK